MLGVFFGEGRRGVLPTFFTELLQIAPTRSMNGSISMAYVLSVVAAEVFVSISRRQQHDMGSPTER